MGLLVLGIILPWLLVGVGCWLGLQLLQQGGRILLRLDMLEERLGQPAPLGGPAPLPAGLPVGAAAPPFALPDLNGQPRSLAEFRGRSVLLAFLDPACAYCAALAPDLAALSAADPHSSPLPLLVSGGDAAATRQLIAASGLRSPCLLDEPRAVAALYHAPGTPMGYLIDAQGQIASELLRGAPALLAMAARGAAPGDSPSTGVPLGNGPEPLGGSRSVAASKLPRTGLTPGTPAPEFTLPALVGGELSLSAYRGHPVLLLFSDPLCGPCDALAPRLEQQYRATTGVQVLMVSRGDRVLNQAKQAEHDLTFPIVLQRQWEVSRRYATFATPVAYLIDPQGLVATPLAAGVEPILALLAQAARRASGLQRHGARTPGARVRVPAARGQELG